MMTQNPAQQLAMALAQAQGTNGGGQMPSQPAVPSMPQMPQMAPGMTPGAGAMTGVANGLQNALQAYLPKYLQQQAMQRANPNFGQVLPGMNPTALPTDAAGSLQFDG